MKTASLKTPIVIGAFEAKTKLSELLERVSAGATFTITNRNRPVARLMPLENDTDGDAKRRQEACDTLKRIRKNCTLGGLNIRELIDQGRA